LTMFNPFDPAFREDPYSQYARILDEAPTHASPLGGWVLARYVDVEKVLRHPHATLGGVMTGDERRQVLEFQGLWDAWVASPLPAFMDNAILLKDPPDHTRLRSVMSKAFTPRAIEALRPHIAALIDELLDDIEGRGETDLVADVAFPLPALVICELLGVPVEDRDALKVWSAAAARLIDPMTGPETFGAAAEALGGFNGYFAALVAERRRQPREDLLSALIAAHVAGVRLTDAELLANMIFLFTAGHETTQNLIGNAVLALLRNPDQLDVLRRRPELIKGAVEEFLRYDPPIQVTGRTILEEPLEVTDITLQPNDRVVLLLAAANRDPAQFDDPGRLDVARPDVRPLSFGGGIHFCLGAALARVEGQVAIGRFVDRFAKIELAGDPVPRDTFTLRGLTTLPLRVSV
jgi:pimeloyl-[acyl-carrier protein] synthase